MGFLTGKTALITGAGRAVLQDGSCGSIGYGIATAYAKEGANLVITGRNVKKLEEAKQELESKYGIKVLPVQADVCAGGDNEATVQRVVNQAVDAFGGIQVLINNAQASASGVSLAEHTTEQFDLALYSGLYAAFYYMKACYPYLKQSHGSVINFASGAGLFGNYGQCAYAAAKEGIRGLSRVAATEWGPDDINVNVVCPLAWTAKQELESKYGIKVLPVQADVCAGGDNEATVQRVVNQAVDAFGGIQVLINNAQASASGVSLAEHTTEQFDLALYSGLYAAFYYMKACYPYLKQSHGSVINFASGAGLFGNYGQCAYAAAKEGIRGLSRVAATEWGPDDINVNVVCPLAWTAKLEQFQQAYPEAFKANVKMPPMGHYGNAELEIGRVCVQLAMPDFKFMSGETLTLEGGMGQRP